MHVGQPPREYKVTLLQAAASGCQKSTVRYLLDQYEVPDSRELRGPQIASLLNSTNHRGDSLLYIACHEGRRKTMCSFVRFLLTLDTTNVGKNNLMHAVASKIEQQPSFLTPNR